MMVYGVSPTTWVERLLKFDGSSAGVQLTLTEKVGNVELERIVVPPDSVLAVVMEPPTGGTTIEGTSAMHHAPRSLDIEIRGNDVLLKIRGGAATWDVAVGLDDFQDALERVITPS